MLVLAEDISKNVATTISLRKSEVYKECVEKYKKFIQLSICHKDKC